MQQRGFTFLELLMVIVTIAVLVAVLIPNVLVSRQRANDVQAQACLKEVSTAQSIYQIGEGGYANDLNNLSAFPGRTCTGIEITTITLETNFFEYTARHPSSDRTFHIDSSSGVSQVP